jgi:type VI secretion system protein ImpM
MVDEAGVGFFGKLASHGDFVSRRLPPPFVAVWDAWMQAALRASREQLGAGWMDAYLTGPLWRFALAPGVCDGQSWCGVLMPSVDRVGRHFPLVLVAATPGAPALSSWLAECAPWFEQLEDLALSTLDAAFSFERFDAALLSMAGLPAPPVQAGADAAGWHIAIPAASEAAGAVDAIASAAMYGQSLWWTDGSERVEPCVRLHRGLPAPQSFAPMLAG